MDYILSIHRVLLYKNMNPANGFLSECVALYLKYLIVYRFISYDNLSARKHAMQFFYAKTSRFLRRFSSRSRRGGNLPPAGTRKRSP